MREGHLITPRLPVWLVFEQTQRTFGIGSFLQSSLSTLTVCTPCAWRSTAASVYAESANDLKTRRGKSAGEGGNNSSGGYIPAVTDPWLDDHMSPTNMLYSPRKGGVGFVDVSKR